MSGIDEETEAQIRTCDDEATEMPPARRALGDYLSKNGATRELVPMLLVASTSRR